MQMRKLSVLYSCGTLLLTIAMACTLMSNMKNEFMKHQDKKGACAPRCSMLLLITEVQHALSRRRPCSAAIWSTSLCFESWIVTEFSCLHGMLVETLPLSSDESWLQGLMARKRLAGRAYKGMCSGPRLTGASSVPLLGQASR